MAIGSLGNTTLSTASMVEMRKNQAASMLKEMDKDKSGTVSKDEFVAFGEKMQSNAPKATGAVTANAATAPSADKLFTAADKNNDSSLSVDELSSMMAEADTRRASSTTSDASAGAGGAAGGPPPAGGRGGPPPGGGMSGAGDSTSSQSKSSSSSTESTDPADANKDGVVSPSEKLLYEMTHPTTTSTAGTAAASTTTA